MKQTNAHTIFCIDCSKKRTVFAQNWKKVKRCIKCQYLSKQMYNTEYIRKRRAKLKKQKNEEVRVG